MSTNHHGGPEIGDDLAITRTTRRASGPGTWVTGTLNGHRFAALVFPEHAKCPDFEMGDSRISKLWAKRLSDGKVVCDFDRGWNIRPTDLTAAAVADFLAAGLAELTYGNRREVAVHEPAPSIRGKAYGRDEALHREVRPKKDIDF